MKLAVNVPRHLGRDEALHRAARAGVRLMDPGQCYLDPARAPNRLLMGFASLPADRLEEAVRRIAAAWK
jgi:DNA-binding transcriptional MocR family regulator